MYIFMFYANANKSIISANAKSPFSLPHLLFSILTCHLHLTSSVIPSFVIFTAPARTCSFLLLVVCIYRRQRGLGSLRYLRIQGHWQFIVFLALGTYYNKSPSRQTQNTRFRGGGNQGGNQGDNTKAPKAETQPPKPTSATNWQPMPKPHTVNNNRPNNS